MSKLALFQSSLDVLRLPTQQRSDEQCELLSSLLSLLPAFAGFEDVIDNELTLLPVRKNQLMLASKFVYITHDDQDLHLILNDFVSMTDSALIALPRSVYDRVSNINSLVTKIKFFSQYPFFALANEALLRDLVSLIPEFTYKQGQNISNAQPNRVLFIKEGSVLLNSKIDKVHRPLAVITKNNVFGEVDYLIDLHVKKNEPPIIHQYEAICHSETATVYAFNYRHLLHFLNKSQFSNFLNSKYKTRIRRLQVTPQLIKFPTTTAIKRRQSVLQQQYQQEVDSLKIQERRSIDYKRQVSEHMGQNYYRIKSFFEQKRQPAKPLYRAFINRTTLIDRKLNHTASIQTSIGETLKIKQSISNSRASNDSFSSSFCRAQKICKRRSADTK